jgi:Domain of unknown function (DUF5666)
VKRFLSVLIAVAFVTGLVGFAAAQTGTTTEKKAGDQTGTTTEKKAGDKTEKKADKKMPTKTASGTVKSASADSLVVAGKEKGKEAEWTFAVDPQTKIKKAGKDIMAGDLKAGDSVSVRYVDQDGKTVAHSVTVRGGGMAKKGESDTKKPATDAGAKPAEKKQ